ncbi:hypothetical protein [Sporofaciens musculi]|uniref:hypothetical protein n=1 Tax=Sporofaciens musculi TaxID=2681861 RepID=UPI002570FBAD|nr:hypothetical protein [Sporofaciens musculi]
MLKKERNIQAVKKERGIYVLINDPIPMQIIVNTQLPPRENRWLSSLKRNLAMDANTKRLLREYKIHRESNLYQAAMDLIMRANQKTMEEAENMVCDVIKEIFEDEWKEKERQFQEKESQFQEKEMRLKKQENRMETLVQYLLKNDLLDELNKISLDRTYREQLYQRYGL